ncbi:MAG: MmgE/PrpD family protein [Mycobacterium kyogaense]|uniref:MmgE/PrpD family protein n=1 Tax=Mycobacterium kyogaense TaxID=2212479 RepID=UPI002FF7E07F
MNATYIVDQLAEFACSATQSDIQSLGLLKRNVLDGVACAVGALDGGLIGALREHVEQFSGSPTATLVGGGRVSVDQAAFFNSVLVRYPDLLDTYLADGGLCHPADNLGAVLAVAEHVDASGGDFLVALAVAYEIQCRFTAQVPLMAGGLNHALSLAVSSSAAAARLLGLGPSATADAISAATVDNVSLAAVHAEPVSMWKGFSPAITAMRAVTVTFLAARGVTGPKAVFDGPDGLTRLLGRALDFRTDDRTLAAAGRTYLKQYCSLIHGQAVIDAALSISAEHDLDADDVESVRVEVFRGAYDFAGGGSYGDKSQVCTKEQADYNLKYLTAVALLDGAVGPEQLEIDRIRGEDVQNLMQRVTVVPDDELSAAYPDRTPVRVHVRTWRGTDYHLDRADYEGSPTQPMSWDRVTDKFTWLAEPFCDQSLRAEIVAAVADLDRIAVRDVTTLLSRIAPTPQRTRTPRRF